MKTPKNRQKAEDRMSDFHTDTVLEMRDLYVGYYKDLNILQGLNIKVQRNTITAVPRVMRLVRPA